MSIFSSSSEIFLCLLNGSVPRFPCLLIIRMTWSMTALSGRPPVGNCKIARYIRSRASSPRINVAALEFFAPPLLVFSFDSSILNQIRLNAKDKNKQITVHTFTDRISILDTLISGNRYLVHPISYEMQKDITLQHMEEMNLIPILNVYRNSYLNNKEGEEGLKELENLRNKDKFFIDNYII